MTAKRTRKPAAARTYTATVRLGQYDMERLRRLRKATQTSDNNIIRMALITLDAELEVAAEEDGGDH